MTDGSGSTTWTYNLVGWALTENRTIAGKAKTISYTYNQDGSLVTIVYPSGRILTYTTNNAQRTTSAIDNTGIQYALTASYAPIGALNSVIYGKVNSGFTGITTTAAYNPRFEPTTISATSTAGIAQSLSYSFALPGGNNGSVATVTNSVNTGLGESFTYDPLNRINSAATSSGTATGCWGQTFGTSGGLSDDQWSNLTQINSTRCSAGTLNVAASSTTNRLSATGFGFDNSGNMTADSMYTYTFDAENHLTQASGMSGGPWNYVYDGNGMRVEKSNAAGGTLYFRSLSGAAIAETDLSGNITGEYVFFAGQRIARRDSGNNVYFYYADQVGSTTAITTGTGTVCYQASFTPYGEEHDTLNNCSQNYKFTGYERDAETGLDYAFARYYNSRLARFMSADPLAGNSGNPQSLNRYAYVGNNPTNYTDPLGLKIMDCMWTGNCGGWNSPGGPGYFGGGGAGCTLDGLDTACGSTGGLGSNDIQLSTTVDGHQFGQNSDGTWMNLANGQELSLSAAAEIGLSPLTMSWPNWTLGVGGGGGAPANNCEQTILTSVNNQFNTSFTAANVTTTFSNGGATNLIITASSATGLTSSQFNGIQTGRYASAAGYLIGLGPSLHIAGPSAFDPQAVFQNSNNGGFLNVTFTAHTDSAFAYNPFGLLVHFFKDVLGHGSRNPCPQRGSK